MACTFCWHYFKFPLFLDFSSSARRIQRRAPVGAGDDQQEHQAGEQDHGGPDETQGRLLLRAGSRRSVVALRIGGQGRRRLRPPDPLHVHHQSSSENPGMDFWQWIWERKSEGTKAASDLRGSREVGPDRYEIIVPRGRNTNGKINSLSTGGGVKKNTPPKIWFGTYRLIREFF